MPWYPLRGGLSLQVESNAGNPGEETFQETSEHGDEGQQPHDGIVDSQNTNGSSSDDLLESFMSGASLEVQERNGKAAIPSSSLGIIFIGSMAVLDLSKDS